MSKGINSRKVAVIGTGFVGSSSAFALMESGLFTEMVLIDADKNRAEGEALDIAHGLPFARPMKITAGDYDDIVDAAIIVVTAGAGQKPGETRLDLVKKNVAIFKSIIPEIAKRNCKGILLIVANPVDILTQVAATRCALNSFTKVLLSNHIKTCVTNDIRSGHDETVDELVEALQKLMK